jgi:hypothetical protein
MELMTDKASIIHHDATADNDSLSALRFCSLKLLANFPWTMK